MGILAHRVVDVDCLSRLPGKEEGFDLPLRLSSSLSQLATSGGKETNMKHLFKGQTYPSHEFILSLGFSRKEGQKCSLLLFSQIRLFLFSAAGCQNPELTKCVAKYKRDK